MNTPFCADINNAVLQEQAVSPVLDFWINQRFTAANRKPSSVAFLATASIFRAATMSLRLVGIFTDAPATGAGQLHVWSGSSWHHCNFGVRRIYACDMSYFRR